jgi:hypothetical protein
MKAQIFDHPDHKREELSIISDRADDVFILGQLTERLPYSTKGLTLDGKISLQIYLSDLIEAALEKKWEENNE